MASWLHRYFRVCRCRRLPSRIRSTKPRALHHPLRDTGTEEPSSPIGLALFFLTSPDFSATSNRVQPRRLELHVDLPHGWVRHPDLGHAESGTARYGVAGAPRASQRARLELVRLAAPRNSRCVNTDTSVPHAHLISVCVYVCTLYLYFAQGTTASCCCGTSRDTRKTRRRSRGRRRRG